MEECFVKIVDLQPLAIFSKLSILDVQQGSGDTSENIGNSRKSILNWLLQGERLRLAYTARKASKYGVFLVRIWTLFMQFDIS